MMKIEITVVPTTSGKFYACGPHDYDEGSYRSEVEAATCWAIEAGEMPLVAFTVHATLPDVVRLPVEADSVVAVD